MASCSSIPLNSNPTPSWKYHVFLSFRGEDTRHNFTDHLYATLCRAGIITFRDDEELERGEVIKLELLQAIEESLFSIIILSENYASSTWCLDELQKILESRKKLHRGVLPVFYGIDPSIVRHQTGSFAEAFKRHQKRFGEDSSKVQGWRDALSEIANLSGYYSKNRLVLSCYLLWIVFTNLINGDFHKFDWKIFHFMIVFHSMIFLNHK